jgi:hypothetical protein
MTLEEFILSRSYLPQNGTYTLLEHLQAMDMPITGVCVGEVITEPEVINVSVKENVVTIEVKSDIIETTITGTKTNVTIEEITEETVINNE